jgi:hypothetical protein
LRHSSGLRIGDCFAIFSEAVIDVRQDDRPVSVHVVFASGALAQLVARRSHNPKVVSSILTGPILGISMAVCTDLVEGTTDGFCESQTRAAAASLSRPTTSISPTHTLTSLRWSSGYDARLTRERSPVQSWDEVFLGLCLRMHRV